jgi:hypothetical protein
MSTTRQSSRPDAKKPARKKVAKRAAKKPAARKRPAAKAKRATKSTARRSKSTSPAVPTDFATKASMATVGKQLKKQPKGQVLAVRSPYRLPIPMDTLASQSARLAGVAFVVVGGLFSMYHAPAALSELAERNSQLAAVNVSQERQPVAATTAVTLDSTTEPKPEELYANVQATYTLDDDRLSVKITAAAKRVTVSLTSESEKRTAPARQTGDTTWQYTWLLDEDELPADRYQLAAEVDTGSGVRTITIPNVTVVYETDEAPKATDDSDTDESDKEATESETTDEAALDTKEVDTTKALAPVLSRGESAAADYPTYTVAALDAERIELYAKPAQATKSLFIGATKPVESGVSRFVWDTTNTPAGTYQVYAEVLSGNRERVTNQLTERIEKPVLEPAITTKIVTEPLFNPLEDGAPLEPTEPTLPPETVAVQALVDTIVREEQPRIAAQIAAEREGAPVATPAAVTAEVDELVDAYDVDIDQALEGLASALRSGDPTMLGAAKQRIDELEVTIAEQSLTVVSEADELAIRARLRTELSDRAAAVEQTETLVRERVGEAITIDTDSDGITDYDERVLYKTDPNSADTDNDGFIDSAEILRGFNPTSPEAEAVIDFESPKDSGFTRSDLLTVANVDTVQTTNSDTGATEVAAVLTGRALPNSFVTLFIFSTPTIVTVRTEADGSWSYTFDKELEEGTHEVYVGVTDNAGRILAKSEPLRFVRTAEAFTPIASAAAVPPVVNEPSATPLFSPATIMFTLALSTMVIGLLLLILGLFAERRRTLPPAVPSPATS